MNQALALLLGMALALALVAWRRERRLPWQAAQKGARSLRQVAPLLVLAFLIGGYLEVLVPPRWVEGTLGVAAGWRAYAVAMLVGVVVPGGPFVALPLALSLWRLGAGLGPVITLATAWAGLSLFHLPFELPFLGWRFTIFRVAISWGLPVLVGWLAQGLFGP